MDSMLLCTADSAPAVINQRSWMLIIIRPFPKKSLTSSLSHRKIDTECGVFIHTSDILGPSCTELMLRERIIFEMSYCVRR